VIVVASFDHTMNCHLGDIIAGESAIVRNIQDTASFFCNNPCKERESSRPIADGRGKSAETSIRSETAFDNSSEDVHVDVTAA